MPNACRTDEVWTSFPTVLGGFGELLTHGQYRLNNTPRQDRAASIMVPLALRSGHKLEWISDGRSFPPALQDVIAQLQAIDALPEGWDSYGGHSLSEGAINPSLELVLMTQRRCVYPTLVLLPSGGIGLRWESPTAELEIDVSPDGRCEAVLDINNSVEATSPGTVAEVAPLVGRFYQTL